MEADKVFFMILGILFMLIISSYFIFPEKTEGINSSNQCIICYKEALFDIGIYQPDEIPKDFIHACDGKKYYIFHQNNSYFYEFGNDCEIIKKKSFIKNGN